MKKFFFVSNIIIGIILICNFIFCYNTKIESEFGKIISNDIVYDNPFLGGFNKPKIHWVDWNKDGFSDLFILDEDGRIRYFLNQNQSFVLQTTDFLGLSNLNWFFIYDFDNDNDYEIVTSSSIYLGGISYYDFINNELIYISEIIDENNSYLDLDQSMIPTFSDIDADGDLDLFSGNIIGTLNFFENKGFSNDIPIFNYETNFWQDIYIVGQSRHGASAISFIDLDGDLDLDLSWGDYFQQSLYIIWNIGDKFNPIMDNDNILTQFPYEEPIFTAGLNLPSFVDIDNDDDNDLFVTTLSGAYGYQLTNNFAYYENIGNSFTYQTNNFIETIDHLTDVNPKFIDIDNDGDLDLFIGTNYDTSSFPWIGKIIFYENKGFELDIQPYWEINNDDFLSINLGNNLFPEFIDIDNDDDLDLFVGNYNGLIHYFKNIGTINNYNFEYQGILNDIDLQGYSAPEFIDIDNDSDYDLLVGCLDGKVYFYENIGDKYNFNFILVSSNYNNINYESRTSVLSFDLDFDQDEDLLVSSTNNIAFYENIGDNLNNQFQLSNDLLFPFTGKNTSLDFYNSCSHAGFIAGISTGGMYFISLNNNLHGDLNNDSILNIYDIIILVELVLGDNYSALIDTNSDCSLDIVDIIDIVSIILDN